MLSKIENFNFYLKRAISDFFLKMKIEFFDSGHELNHPNKHTERTYTHKLTTKPTKQLWLTLLLFPTHR